MKAILKGLDRFEKTIEVETASNEIILPYTEGVTVNSSTTGIMTGTPSFKERKFVLEDKEIVLYYKEVRY